MKYNGPKASDQFESREIADQLALELAILLRIEEALRFALQWMTRDRGNSHKLSTLRFHTWSFERHLSRIAILADHGGYMQLITDATPHLVGEVEALRDQRAEQHANLENIIARLEYVSGDNAHGFEQICADLGRLLDALTTHGRKESELLQYSFTQEEGGSG